MMAGTMDSGEVVILRHRAEVLHLVEKVGHPKQERDPCLADQLGTHGNLSGRFSFRSIYQNNTILKNNAVGRRDQEAYIKVTLIFGNIRPQSGCTYKKSALGHALFGDSNRAGENPVRRGNYV